MKLRAKITRTDDWRTRSFKAVFPKGVAPVMKEAILERNLGARPYAEISLVQNGETVRIWVK